jgi:hypothetical protein
MPRPQTSVAKSSPNRSAGSGASTTPAVVFDDVPPMRQRRGLFFALLAIFFVWIAAVLIMYFTTVRPHGGRLEPLPPTTANTR